MHVAVMLGGMFARIVIVVMTMMNVVMRACMRVIVIMIVIVILGIVGSACVLMIASDRRRLAGLQIKQCCFAILASTIRAH
jgi:hypothetical protein